VFTIFTKQSTEVSLLKEDCVQLLLSATHRFGRTLRCITFLHAIVLYFRNIRNRLFPLAFLSNTSFFIYLSTTSECTIYGKPVPNYRNGK
jgi:hypothetical protein